MGRGTRPNFAQPALTPRTKRVIELAVDEARKMGNHYIGTEHLLLGLVREGEGVAVDVLRRMGAPPEKVREQVNRVLHESPVHAGGREQSSATPTVDQLGTDLTTLADALDNVSMAAPLTLHDVPNKTADLHATNILLKNQRKHFMNLTMGSRNMRYQIEMQLAVRGSREEIKKRPLFLSRIVMSAVVPGFSVPNSFLNPNYLSLLVWLSLFYLQRVPFYPLCDILDPFNHIVVQNHVAYAEDDWISAHGFQKTIDECLKDTLIRSRLQKITGDPAPDERALAPLFPSIFKRQFGERLGRKGFAHIESGFRQQIHQRFQVPVRMAARLFALCVQKISVFLVLWQTVVPEQVRVGHHAVQVVTEFDIAQFHFCKSVNDVHHLLIQ